jgi:quinol-cytochrome oxidoreductase complex cytochrome b subunit
MPRLLLLACSRRKHPTPFPVPAWYRYDGVLYRLCKNLEAHHAFPTDVSVWILSAAYGLISKDTPIPWYDQSMSPERARSIRADVTAALGNALTAATASEVFIAAGKAYRESIGELPTGIVAVTPSGGIGAIQSQLRTWLTSGSPSAQLAIPLNRGT